VPETLEAGLRDENRRSFSERRRRDGKAGAGSQAADPGLSQVTSPVRSTHGSVIVMVQV